MEIPASPFYGLLYRFLDAGLLDFCLAVLGSTGVGTGNSSGCLPGQRDRANSFEPASYPVFTQALRETLVLTGCNYSGADLSAVRLEEVGSSQWLAPNRREVPIRALVTSLACGIAFVQRTFTNRPSADILYEREKEIQQCSPSPRDSCSPEQARSAVSP